MATICSYSMDPEGKLLDHIINEFYSVLLCLALVYLEYPDSGRIVDCRILKTADSSSIDPFKPNELHIDLNMMSRDCFSIPFGMDSPSRSSFW